MGKRKLLLLSDSFKGTLSSREICRIARAVVPSEDPDWALTALPVADGGEGTVDCFLEACGGQRITVSVTGPWGEPLEAAYARLGDTAVVEMAAAAGLPLVGDRRDPSRTTTYGVGQLLRHALDHGARRLVLALGGSATHDGGCGAAAALGVRFHRRGGETFCPVGATLEEIDAIDLAEAQARLQGVEVEIMCDVNNPLCGPRGAAAVFGPQKGADDAMAAMLDRGLAHLSQVITRDLGKDVASLPGAGAAGGFGGGAVAFFGGVLRPGIEVVLDLIQFDALLTDCDLVITGEGRLDRQSLGGKVPVGVARRAKAAGVPVAALVGSVEEGLGSLASVGITGVFVTNRADRPASELARWAEADYRSALTALLRRTPEYLL